MTDPAETLLYPYRHSPDQDCAAPARRKVIVIGAGPVGLSAAVDLAQRGIETVVLEERETVGTGSRAISFARRPLEIFDRLGVAQDMLAKGVEWSNARVYFGTREIYRDRLEKKEGTAFPPFINLQQYHLEAMLITRLRALQSEGAPVEIRGHNKVEAVGAHDDHVTVEIATPDGAYTLEGDWLIACDGAWSAIRRMLGLEFSGQSFEDKFLIADVTMEADFPPDRRFWFDPPFNPGQSALLHKQPDNLWRIDLQLGKDVDPEVEQRRENVLPRLKQMLGPDVSFELEWAAVYSFHCRRMEQFAKGRVLFAGDAAHQVSPHGSRGANGGIQDIDNLVWKLALVLEGSAPEALLESYDVERAMAADEDIRQSTQATGFVTPGSEMKHILRDSILDLSERHEFARELVNSGRLSEPCTYDASPLNSADALDGPEGARPGSPCPDVPLEEGQLLPQLANRFTLLTIDAEAPDVIEEDGVTVTRLALETRKDPTRLLQKRYLGNAPSGVYLIRPDQHIAARRPTYDETQVRAAIRRATGKE